MSQYTYYSALDIKAEFQVILLHLSLWIYIGIVILDGLHMYLHMDISFCTAPSYFQFYTYKRLDVQPNLPHHITYLDDVTLGGEYLTSTWRDIIKALGRLTGARFALNA